jgi:hypothetical protein
VKGNAGTRGIPWSRSRDDQKTGHRCQYAQFMRPL